MKEKSTDIGLPLGLIINFSKMRYIHFKLAVAFFATAFFLKAQTLKEVARFQVKEARQAVAVDDKYFYVINNSSITKHEKSSGQLLTSWEGENLGVRHMNSGIIIDGKLYCANSNYPQSPMASSIEIFDPVSMTHVETHSFGIFVGSAAWIDRKDGFWYVGFANYSGKRSSDNKDSRWTQVLKLNDDWNRVEGWIFPEDLVEKFMPMSNSGAVWYGHQLWITGHDNHELYIVELPQTGYELKYIKTLEMPGFGQGISLDTSVPGKKFLYGIIKEKNEVVVAEIFE